ncbi:MAG TPA: DUF998 domain-containing protein [Gallionellaceae bacterium]|nr:DUF998 domain-containing protein [Gallionellaceae bacterium]
MSQRMLFDISWAAIIAAMLAMVVGHTGATHLSWEANEISTYAAQAPHQNWITAGMLLPCVAFASISMLISRYRVLGDSAFAHFAPLLAGAAIGGLMTLATFKEAAPTTAAALKTAGLEAVVQQSFHNAGLMGFFFATVLLVILTGTLVAANAATRRHKLAAAAAVLLGIAALPLMETPWPRLLDIPGPALGLTQRASLFSLWLGAVLILAGLQPALRPRRPAGRASGPAHAG